MDFTYNLALVGGHDADAKGAPHQNPGEDLPYAVHDPAAGKRHEQRAQGIENDEDERHEQTVDRQKAVVRAGLDANAAGAAAAARGVA